MALTDSETGAAFGAAAGTCTLCGGPSTGFWQGSAGVIGACSRCATDTLPLLIADAVVGGRAGTSFAVLDVVVVRITSAFWRGATNAIANVLRASRGVRPASKEPTDG